MCVSAGTAWGGTTGQGCAVLLCVTERFAEKAVSVVGEVRSQQLLCVGGDQGTAQVVGNPHFVNSMPELPTGNPVTPHTGTPCSALPSPTDVL